MNNLAYNNLMDNSLYLNIYDVCFKVNSACFDLVTRIHQDFYVYQLEQNINLETINLNVFQRSEQSKKKDIVYKDGPVVRMCHFSKDADIFCEEIERLHELTYLYILSVLGKILDLRGMHRIHASAISFEDGKANLFVGASGAGKSHLAYFLEGETLSDDTLFLDCEGNVYPLLIRRGFNCQRSEDIKSDDMYKLIRHEYGEKFLIAIKEKTKKSSYTLNSIYLLKLSDNVNKTKASILYKCYYFFLYELVGLGTPQMIEFFWEPGIKDFYLKIKIFFLRLKLFFFLIFFRNVQILRTNRTAEILSLFATNSGQS